MLFYLIVLSNTNLKEPFFSFQVRYTACRERAPEERQIRFINGCREGHTEIAFVASGTNLQIVFNANQNPYIPDKECDFDKEHGKVSINILIDHFRLLNFPKKNWST